MGTTRIPPATVDGLFGKVVTVTTRRMFGQTPASIGVMWHHKQVFRDSMGFGRKVESWDRLDRNLATYASMAAAASIGCNFCLDLGYFMSHHKGLDEVTAREVPRWRESSAFTPLERQVMEYAEGMCTTPVTVTDELAAALLADLGEAALVELTARVGFMNSSARSNIALGIPSEEFAEACGLPPLSERPAESGRLPSSR